MIPQEKGLAGEQGLEPQQAVLETAVLPLYDTPMWLPIKVSNLGIPGQSRTLYH